MLIVLLLELEQILNGEDKAFFEAFDEEWVSPYLISRSSVCHIIGRYITLKEIKDQTGTFLPSLLPNYPIIISYRVVFFNWPPPEFAKCWPVSNRFRKESQTGPPPYDRKKSKCLGT